MWTAAPLQVLVVQLNLKNIRGASSLKPEIVDLRFGRLGRKSAVIKSKISPFIANKKYLYLGLLST